MALQELVVLHLTIDQNVLGKPVSVTADFPDVIRNAQPDLKLRSGKAQMFDQPRQITVTVDKDGEPTRVSVFLRMECVLAPGDQVQWVLAGAVTEELLSEQDVVSQVDLWQSRLSVVATRPWLY